MRYQLHITPRDGAVLQEGSTCDDSKVGILRDNCLSNQLIEILTNKCNSMSAEMSRSCCNSALPCDKRVTTQQVPYVRDLALGNLGKLNQIKVVYILLLL